MTPIDREQLLWNVADEVPDQDGEVLEDGVLDAYRAGELDVAEAARVEAVLIASAAGREQLAEGAGVVLETPPEAIRRRLLDAPAAEHSRRTGHSGRWRLAAALVATALLGAFGYWMFGQGAPVAEPRLAGYRVTVEALTERRSTPGAERVLPDTRVVIDVEPEGAARADVEFALYRLEAGAARRLEVAPPIERVVTRGAARFVAPASALVGDRTGEVTIWVVASAGGSFPGAVEGSVEEITRRLAAGGRFAAAHRFLVQQYEER